MKYLSTGNISKYLYNNFIGNFLGFIVGMASTRIVAHFFATKSLKNLWGLTSKKTIVDKSTFSNLQLLVSVVIGYIVFEIISKFVQNKMKEWFPVYKESFMNWWAERWVKRSKS